MNTSLDDITDEEIRLALGERHVEAMIRLREGDCQCGDGQLFLEVIDYCLEAKAVH